jgi:uncharacterized protein YjbI with pentapeptide repeats
MIATGTLKKYVVCVSVAASLIFLCADCRRYYIKNILISKKLEGINLSGMDFYNMNLKNVNLTKARLVRTNFSFALLSNAKFANADLRNADLSGADLSGADFRGANLRNTDLRNAVMKKANLVGAYFYSADLSGADLREAILTSGPADSTGPSGTRVAGSGAAVTYFVHLRNADLTGTAIGISMKDFIEKQEVRNFKKIIWSK